MTAATLQDRHLPRPVIWIASLLAVLVIVTALFLTFADWNALRGPIGREASAISGHPIRIEGNLEVHPWSWTPRAVVGGLKIGNPTWAGGGLLADIPSMTIGVRLGALLTGHLELTQLELNRPRIWLFVDKYGRASWAGPGHTGAPPKLPPIERFIIDNGQLGLADLPRDLTLGGILQSHEITRADGGGSFQLTGDGAFNHRAFKLMISGAPLLNIRAGRPYQFSADMRAGETHITASGVLPKPFDFGQVSAALTLSGRDLADLYELTGVALPNTPPFKLAGDLVRDDHRYTVTHMHGVVGSSDLAGDFQVDRIKGRPTLHADLHSHSLDVRDLGSLIGAPRSGAATSLEQSQAAARKAQGRILPDATLAVGRIRSTDAVLHYRADTLKAQANLPLNKVVLDLTLDHGVLTMDPIAFSLPRGAITGKIRIDARTETPKDDIDARISHARLEDFFKSAATAPVTGGLEARAQLHAEGDSMHKAASTATGTVAFAVPNGQIRRLLAEALGIDATKALGLFLSKDNSQTGVRCAVANFSATNGLLTATNLVLDTDQVQARGQGTIDLSSEALNLSLTGEPKTFRLIRVAAPITLTGRLGAPKVGVKPGKAAGQVAAAVALAVVATPAAAVLPFIDPGLAHDANCAGLLTQARQEGAPVKSAAILAAPRARR